MRTQALLAAGLFLTTVAAVSLPAEAASSAGITLRVGPAGFVVPSHWAAGNPSTWAVDTCSFTDLNSLDGVACCSYIVEDSGGDDRIDGIEALNAAVEQGCITTWGGQDFGFGIFVTNVDGLDEVGWPAAWWLMQVDGMASQVGVSDLSLSSGSVLEFVYEPGP